MCDHGRLRTGTAARVSRPTTCDAAAGSVFAFARLSLAQGTLVGGLVESLTGLPGGTLPRGGGGKLHSPDFRLFPDRFSPDSLASIRPMFV